MIVLGIDPGPEQSAWFLWDAERNTGLARGYDHNLEVLSMLLLYPTWGKTVNFVCEAVRSYGMPVGAPVFDMCMWIGRFWQAVDPAPFHLVPFQDVRAYLCRSTKAKDGNMRLSLIEQFGPVGTKKKPGPFYGVSNHIWSAAGVAITWAALQKAKEGRSL